jgi:hypothetical protein
MTFFRLLFWPARDPAAALHDRVERERNLAELRMLLAEIAVAR